MLTLRYGFMCLESKPCWIYIYELKLSVVMLYVVGMYQSVLYTLEKEFELRFGVKKGSNN